MKEFLSTYGLWAAFLLALVENDVAFIVLGVVVKLGEGDNLPDLNAYAAIPAAIIGALLHDTGWYALGYLNSEAIKASRVYRRVGPTIERLAKRFGAWEIVIARFIYGTRNPSSVFWGIQHLPYAEFAALELLALTIWGSLLTFLGYHFTGWAQRLIGKVESHTHSRLIIGSIIAAFVVVTLLRFFNRRGIAKIQQRAAARAQAAEDEAHTADGDREKENAKRET
jgi:membrane protein DedA with SNARE-associated domain